MVIEDTEMLRKKLSRAQDLRDKATTIEEKLAISNYIGNLYRALICMGDKVKYSKKKCFGSSKNYHKIVKRLDVYSDKLLENYILQKDFHQQFISEIIPEVEDELVSVIPSSFDISDSTFSQKEFYEVVMEFLKSIHQDEKFQELNKKGRIHSCVVGQQETNLGFALFNPFNGESNIFIKNFQYDLHTMNTLVHEFGHTIDLADFKGKIEDYNHYFYISFYGEVISRMMERLLMRYLIQNNIKKDATKDLLIEMEDLNHDYLLQAYMLSLLDKDFLLQDGNIDCNSEEIEKRIKDYFIDGADLRDTIERMSESDLGEIYNYMYGDIISLFLCEEVEKEGYANEMMEYFLSQRPKLFKEEFLRECGFGPVNYMKKYKKEIELLKK